MEQIELNVSPRTVIGKRIGALRRSGSVPAVLYGRHQEPVHLQANDRELMKVLVKAGSSRLVALRIAGEAEPHMALVREIQREPIKGNLWHVDFYGVSMTEEITVEVPIRYEGTSPAAALNEGILTYGSDTIEIECLPGDLIDAVVINLSGLLKVGDAIHVQAEVHDAALLGARGEVGRVLDHVGRAGDDHIDSIEEALEERAVQSEHALLPHDVGVVQHDCGNVRARPQIRQLAPRIRKVQVDDVGR